jgi:ParB-like chromosome segregation protein Spo0J
MGSDSSSSRRQVPCVERPGVAVMLGLANKIQQAIDGGAVRDRAEIARRLGFTRARITHLLDLTLLSPDLQEQVLFLQAIDGVQPVSERVLRAVAHAGTWEDQRRAWTALSLASASSS